ncbi:MAG: hypothetical protein K1X29_04160 [Bdellovibrionales bacterium]|nr:hypothetical protein [Bdellovibrionales bacterium]
MCNLYYRRMAHGKNILSWIINIFNLYIFIAVVFPQSPSLALDSYMKNEIKEQNLKIIYGSSAWNTNSAILDSAFLFLRDLQSGKVVKIQLEESEPDSSVFQGQFIVNLDSSGAAINPEIYIPLRTMKDNEQAIKKFNQLLTQNQIKPKPFLYKEGENKIKIIDVYDTEEQVNQARQAYAEEQKIKNNLGDKKNLIQPFLKKQELEVAKKVEQTKKIDQMAAQAAKRLLDRIRLEQIERQKNDERERQLKAMSEKQKEIRQKQAEEIAKEALEDYQNGRFKEAEEKFHKSVELNASETSYYFRFGVTLYRNEKFNEALVTLKLTPDTPDILLEKKYYMALCHMRLNEPDLAMSFLKEVGEIKDSPLAPSALFYQGIILFGKGDYESARSPFEKVIDVSSDPKLDQQAEEYLDRLVILIQQKKAMAKKIFVNGSAGLMYDSNVLLAPDTETLQGSATKKGDLRYSLAGDVEYRPLYNLSHELGVKASGYYLFSSHEDVSLADPLLWNVAIPYSYKGMAFGKGYKFSLKPSYEVLYMDENSDGTRDLVLQSSIVNLDHTFLMHKNWFSSYLLEFRNDDSLSASSLGEDNADALKISLKTLQTFLLDQSAKEVLAASAGYVINNAKGNNKYYSRYEVGAFYVRPVIKGAASFNLGINYYLVEYSKRTEFRQDNNTTVSTGITKPVKPWWSWNVSGTYSTNISSEAASSYNKYSIMANALFNYAL